MADCKYQEFVEEWSRLHVYEGWSIRALSRQYNCPREAIKRVLLEHGYTISLKHQNNITPEERYWFYVIKTKENDCWGWNGPIHWWGYGRMSIKGKTHMTHIFSWDLHFPNQPRGDLFVCHKCDNPPCSNPNHLFLGTQQDNINDAKNKGRILVGENNPSSILTKSDVIDIRNKYNPNGPNYYDLANAYGVSHAAIWQVVNGNNWKHLL